MTDYDYNTNPFPSSKGIAEDSLDADFLSLNLSVSVEELHCIKMARNILNMFLDEKYTYEETLAYLNTQDKDYMTYMVKRMNQLLRKGEITFTRGDNPIST